jgi:hypothetical protein
MYLARIHGNSSERERIILQARILKKQQKKKKEARWEEEDEKNDRKENKVIVFHNTYTLYTPTYRTADTLLQ